MIAIQPCLQLISLIDATNLDEQATEQDMIKLCQLVKSAPTYIASICVYPKWIHAVNDFFKTKPVTITTVINFPKSNLDSKTLEKEIKQAIELGADEIDIVFPYETFDPKNTAPTLAFLQAAKQACGDHVLKVIIESGEAPSAKWIEQATLCVVNSGANFVKTSTGKTTTGATTEAVRTIAYTLHEADRPCGLKISGGVRTIEQAQTYIKIVESILSPSFIEPEWFRFGASSLLKSCIETIEK